MNEHTIEAVHLAILDHYKIRAKKSFGQNFLNNDFFLEKIVQATDLHGAHIVEIGPGYGALTSKILSHQPSSLTLVELDSDMIHILRDRVRPGSKFCFESDIPVEIREQDILKLDTLPESPSKIIANIPYYITSPILTHALQRLADQISDMVIMMQKEVAEKIINAKKHSFLSLGCWLFCDDIELITFVPKEAFIPAPKVDSAVLHFRLKAYDPGVWAQSQAILKVASAGFREPRKKLISNLTKYFGGEKSMFVEMFDQLGLDENLRAEDLTIENWKEIYKIVGGSVH